jgi:predicted GNAT family N-acyltransferase
MIMSEIVVETANWSEDSAALVKLRTKVFVEEQKVPSSLEVDGIDGDCFHVKALADNQCIGTGRLLPDGYIGRMCVLEAYRGRGIGTLMLENLIEQAIGAGQQQVILNSQSSAIPFYEKNGFTIESEEFVEAGIPHRRMARELGNC